MTNSQERGRNQREEFSQTIIREVEFPQDLDGRMEAILSAFNAGPKTALAFVLSGTFQPVESITSSLHEKLAGSQMSSLDPKVIVGYCRTLCKVGLVAEEAFIDSFGKEVPVAFRLTKDGVKYCPPAAARIFIAERRNRRTLYNIFGQAQKPDIGEHRASLTRSKILRVLLDGGRQVDKLSTMLGIPMSIISHATDSLKEVGLVAKQEHVTFSLRMRGDVYVTPVKHERRLTDMVVNICRVLNREDVPITQADVFDRLPEDYKSKLNERKLRVRISETLAGLAKQKFLKRGRLDIGQRSFVSLTRRGKRLVDTLITPLANLLSDGEILEITTRELLPQVMRDLHAYVRSSTDYYYPHSKSFLRIQRIERMSRLVSVLSQIGREGISSDELATILGENRYTIHGILNSLVRQHKAGMEKRRGENRYFSVSNDLVHTMTA